MSTLQAGAPELAGQDVPLPSLRIHGMAAMTEMTWRVTVPGTIMADHLTEGAAREMAMALNARRPVDAVGYARAELMRERREEPVYLNHLEAMGLSMALMTEEDHHGGLSEPQRDAQRKLQAVVDGLLSNMGRPD